MDVEAATEQVMVKPPPPIKPMPPPGSATDPYDDMRSSSLKAAANQNNNSSSNNGNRKKRQSSPAEVPMEKEPPPYSLLVEYPAEATACAFNPKDPSLVASGSSDGKVSVHKDQTLLYTFEHEPAEITCLQWSSDGKLLVAGTFGGNARIWSVAAGGELLHVLAHGNEAPVLAAKFHPSNAHLVATVHSSAVLVWRDAVEVLRLSDHKDIAMDLDWHPSRDALASCSKDKSVMVYQFSISGDNDSTLLQISDQFTLNGHFDEVNAVRWCPHDPEVLASCSDDTTVILWRPFQGAIEMHRFADHNQEIYALEWNPREPLLAT